MKVLFAYFFILSTVFAQTKPETFVVQLYDRSITVLSPEAKKNIFSVLVENHSLSDQVGKFMTNGKILKFVSVKTGQTEAVEIEKIALQIYEEGFGENRL